RVLHDRAPCSDRLHRPPRFAPVADQPRTHERVFDAGARIEIPAIAGAARAAAGFVVRQVRPGARVVGLLGLPGDDAALDVDLPRARAGAVHPVRRTHDLVRRPPLSIGVLPIALLVRGDAVTVGELVAGDPKVSQAIEEMTHSGLLLPGRCEWRRG